MLPSEKNVFRRYGKILLIIVAGILAGLVAPVEFSLAQRLMTGIFFVAAGLWVTEAIPPFATSILVIVACVYFLGLPGGALGFEHERDYTIFIIPLADPVIVLFLGGFFLAIASSKHGLDRVLAFTLLRPFTGSANRLTLGVILVTGSFSMFMSNTATALMMMAILTPLMRTAPPGDMIRVKLALAVAFAANIGGMGTIIGTPPNAIAVSALANVGIKVTFLSWMMVGTPLALLLLLLLWVLLGAVFPSQSKQASVFGEIMLEKPGRNTWLVGLTFLATISLWMTEALHGLSPAVVAMLPIAVFTATGLLSASDLKRIEWDVLVLVAGGLALGVGLQKTGLSEKIAALVPNESLPQFMVLFLLAGITVFLSNFMSNTSAANILIPIAISLGTLSPLVGAGVVALCASLAMSLPISTPPNAVVYGTGIVTSQQMLLAGTLVSLCGVCVLFFIFIFFSGF